MKQIHFLLILFVLATIVPACSHSTCPTYSGSIPLRNPVSKKKHKKKGNEPWKDKTKQKKGKKGASDIIPQ